MRRLGELNKHKVASKAKKQMKEMRNLLDSFGQEQESQRKKKKAHKGESIAEKIEERKLWRTTIT